jgi:hypothetical protein
VGSGVHQWYPPFVDLGDLTPEERERWAALSPEERALVLAREPIWREAQQIAAKNPGVDAGDVVHVLTGWNDKPSERLRKSLARAGTFARAR